MNECHVMLTFSLRQTCTHQPLPGCTQVDTQNHVAKHSIDEGYWFNHYHFVKAGQYKVAFHVVATTSKDKAVTARLPSPLAVYTVTVLPGPLNKMKVEYVCGVCVWWWW